MANEDQIEYWNDKAGPEWVAEQDRLDHTVTIHGDAVLERSNLEQGLSVLDVGCGTGQTTVTVAKAVGAEGLVQGIDISRVMLDSARKRAAEASVSAKFTEADAQESDLGRDLYDRVISRFGVMFFDDSVRAFSNLRVAAKPGALLTFVCWQGVAENPWVALPARAMAQVLPLPERDPEAPGPFALADRAKIERVLGAAGWQDLTVEPAVRDISFGDGGVAATLDFLLSIGPVASIIRQVEDPDLQGKAKQAIRQTIESLANDGQVALGSATWLVQAKA